jgi:hypothetical protein
MLAKDQQYSIYLLFWYKSINTEAEAGAQLGDASERPAATW